MKSRLLVLELWGLGDLVIATPFLQAASRKFQTTLIAKPYAQELGRRLWPEVEIIPLTAPWTAFRQKYQIWRWPWKTLFRIRNRVLAQQFDYGVSARWDPRDHLALKLCGVRERFGFPRIGSQRYLTRRLLRPAPTAHRYEAWRTIGQALSLKLPALEHFFAAANKPEKTGSAGEDVGAAFNSAFRVQRPPVTMVHSGARLPLRVWPLERFREMVLRLRQENIPVQLVCDPDQVDWWQSHGEMAACPHSVTELLALIDGAGVLIGNDSGPGHLAAALGCPTFTLFGPQLPEWFVPLHPAAEFVAGKACPYKPCSDYCRFSEPFCLRNIPLEEVWPRVANFVTKNLK